MSFTNLRSRFPIKTLARWLTTKLKSQSASLVLGVRKLPSRCVELCRGDRVSSWLQPLETTSRATKTDNCWKRSETCQHWSAPRVAASARSCWLEELRNDSNAPLGACYWWWWWWWTYARCTTVTTRINKRTQTVFGRKLNWEHCYTTEVRINQLPYYLSKLLTRMHLYSLIIHSTQSRLQTKHQLKWRHDLGLIAMTMRDLSK